MKEELLQQDQNLTSKAFFLIIHFRKEYFQNWKAA